MGVFTQIQEGLTRLVIWANANSAALYTSVGVSSGLASVISGIAVTPEVTRRLDNEKAERKRFGLCPMTFWEQFKIIAPNYIPCALLFGTSALCFIMNTLKEERRIATLAGLYSMSEKSFEEYRNKVKDLFGERKEQKVCDGVAIDKGEAARNDGRVYLITGEGNYPCLETFTNTKFRSNQLTIEQGRIAILDRLRSEMYISLQEALDEMKIPVRANEYGGPLVDRTDIGWNTGDNLEVKYSYTGDSNTEPMMVITFRPSPHPNFNKFW